MIKWITFLSFVLLTACHVNKQSSTSSSKNEENKVEEKASDKFGENYFVVENQSKTYSLVKSKTKKFSEIGFDITYFIYDNQTNEIIIEGFLKSGFIDWIDGTTVKVVDRKINETGTREKEVYEYNVQTKTRKDVN